MRIILVIPLFIPLTLFASFALDSNEALAKRCDVLAYSDLVLEIYTIQTESLCQLKVNMVVIYLQQASALLLRKDRELARDYLRESIWYLNYALTSHCLGGRWIEDMCHEVESILKDC